MILGICNKEAKVDERNCTCIQCTCKCIMYVTLHVIYCVYFFLDSLI